MIAPLVRDALVVQGPAGLLVVVRDLDVPENDRHARDRTAPPTDVGLERAEA
jgi:hypothetical protein